MTQHYFVANGLWMDLFKLLRGFKIKKIAGIAIWLLYRPENLK